MVFGSVELPPKKFYMVRHGETEANVKGVAAGSVDTPLTERGRSQAEGLRQILGAVSLCPTIIVHSQLSRARETARIMNASLNARLVENRDIAECSFGDWAGEPWKVVQERVRQGLEPPNGESGHAFLHRAMKGISAILAMNELALIVTHGGVFDALATYYGCMIADVENCHLYEFDPQVQPHKFPWGVWHYFLIDRRRAGKSCVDIVPRNGVRTEKLSE
ncbi:MAG: histidine phosphatase family protein [Alphaproteobacteria bacterium]|nr:histidine phosphatase family protein [Alphaproteobacteria bacterium]